MALKLIPMCAWCKRPLTVEAHAFLEANDTLRRLAARGTDCAQPVPYQVTHGICERCKDIEMADLRAQPTAKRCLHGRAPDEWCTDCEATTGCGGGA